MQKTNPKKKIRKPQSQRKPGIEQKMDPRPIADLPRPGKLLQNKVALITGGDSGIGRAVAILFAKEGADVVISYLNEERDAKEVQNIVQNEYGRNCLTIPGNIRKEKFCSKIVSDTVRKFGRIDILVNNAATQTEQKSLED